MVWLFKIDEELLFTTNMWFGQLHLLIMFSNWTITNGISKHDKQENQSVAPKKENKTKVFTLIKDMVFLINFTLNNPCKLDQR